MRVTDLWVYPVKSLGGVRTDDAERIAVEPWGLVGDRRWALVDETGKPITAREVHSLLGLTAAPVDAETMRITDQQGASILVEAPIGVPPVPVGHSRQGSANPADDDVNDWLTARAGRPVRLVWQEDPTVRTLSPDRGGMPGEHLSLADAGPVLLVTRASMAQLNLWVGSELDIQRFRANVVIDGDEPFAEDDWAGVRIGDVDFRTTMICDRCVMTTIDPDTLESGKEPIRTLATHRRWEGATWFGIRLVALGPGDLGTGDEVTPLP